MYPLCTYLTNSSSSEPVSAAAETVGVLFSELSAVGDYGQPLKTGPTAELLHVLSGNLKYQDFGEFYSEFVKSVLGTKPSPLSSQLEHILSINTSCV